MNSLEEIAVVRINFENTKTATPTIRSRGFTLEAHPFRFSQRTCRLTKKFERSTIISSRVEQAARRPLALESLRCSACVTCRDHRENERRLRIYGLCDPVRVPVRVRVRVRVRVCKCTYRSVPVTKKEYLREKLGTFSNRRLFIAIPVEGEI